MKKNINKEFLKQFKEVRALERFFLISYNYLSNLIERFNKAKNKNNDFLLKSLICRLDVLVWLSGIANSINEARQLVSHKFIAVNGRISTISSFVLKENDNVKLMKFNTNNILKKNFDNKGKNYEFMNLIIENNNVIGFTLLRFPSLSEVNKIYKCDESTVADFFGR